LLINIDEESYEIERPKFKLWLTLEKLRDRLLTAVDKLESEAFCNAMFSYLSTVGINGIEDAPWYKVTSIFGEITSQSIPKVEMPFMSYPGDTKEVPWNYEGREWFGWATMIVQKTGWTLEYIAELEIEDGLALIQELLVSEQFEREWQWERSQWAYSYNERTKSSEHHELPRPAWMIKGLRKEGPKKIKIRKSMMPVGNVVRYKPEEMKNEQL
jgi:hypothetical protein